MGFFQPNDVAVALQVLGPTDQDALVIPGQDNNDISKINLPPTLHVRAVQAKEKPPTSYTFTLIKTRRLQASFPLLQKHGYQHGESISPDVIQAKGSEF